MGGCTFLEDIYRSAWLFRRHFWVGVTAYSTFLGGCASLEHIYEWVWLLEHFYGWVWLGATYSGWVCKMVKPIVYMWLGNTYYNFRYLAIMLSIRSHGFDRSELCQTSNMNLSAKIINGYKVEFKTLSNIWDEAFSQVVTGYRDEFRILPNIYDRASVFLQTMINLTNVIKVFVSFGISIAKKGVFIDIFTYCNVRKSTVFFTSSIFNQMSLLIISVDNSGVAGGTQMERFASNNHC